MSLTAKSRQRLANHLVGWCLYPAGDLIGQLIAGGGIDPWRLLMVMLIGGLVYRLEIPAYFRFLDSRRINDRTLARLPVLRVLTKNDRRAGTDLGSLSWLGKTLGAMLYFNPLWIARHVFVLQLATLFSGGFEPASALSMAISTGLIAFVTNVPFSFIGNYIVQERLSLHHRFLGSALLTAFFTIKYAIELRLFG